MGREEEGEKGRKGGRIRGPFPPSSPSSILPYSLFKIVTGFTNAALTL